MTVECGVQGQHAWRLSPPLSVVRNTMTHTAQARAATGQQELCIYDLNYKS